MSISLGGLSLVIMSFSLDAGVQLPVCQEWRGECHYYVPNCNFLPWKRKKSRSINTFYMQDMYLCAEIWYAKENEWWECEMHFMTSLNWIQAKKEVGKPFLTFQVCLFSTKSPLVCKVPFIHSFSEVASHIRTNWIATWLILPVTYACLKD